MNWHLPLGIFLGVVGLLIDKSGGLEVTANTNKPMPKGPKLLVIMIDGFRWDYYQEHKSELNALDEWSSEGVQAEWLEPVFPSLSYPNWHTLSTGLYPENHGILGNYMYDQKTRAVFDIDNLDSTLNPDWWQGAEPIWITATREQKKVFLRHWSRCDVPFQESRPNQECSGYRVEESIGAVYKTLNATLHNLRDNDLLMVYFEYIDYIGHRYGPDSTDMKHALKEINRALKTFLDELYDDYADIEPDLNIVILSDHGMIESGMESNLTHVPLNEYLNMAYVTKVLGNGGSVAIAPFPRHKNEVYDGLKKMVGVDVYWRHEIPEQFHYKNNRLVLEILIVAQPGFNIRGIPQQRARDGTLVTSKQIPVSPLEVERRTGSHGYAKMNEMRGIFFAKGPEFKNGIIHPSIGMEDVYQIMTHILRIKPKLHNGTWSRVVGMFKNDAILPKPFSIMILIVLTICGFYSVT